MSIFSAENCIFLVVVIWSDLLGGVFTWTNTLPWDSKQGYDRLYYQAQPEAGEPYPMSPRNVNC